MRRWIILLLLLALTTPDGKKLYIAWDGIEVVRHSSECKQPAQTEVRASTGTYCVQESVEDVRKMIEDAEKAAEPAE